eukprot:jgi/Mesvir1/23320/Mv21016-RA.1
MNSSSGSVSRTITEDEIKNRVRRRNRAQTAGLGVGAWLVIGVLVAGVAALVYFSNQDKGKQAVPEGALVGGGPVDFASPLNDVGGHTAGAFRMGETSGVPGSKSDFFTTFNQFLG